VLISIPESRQPVLWPETSPLCHWHWLATMAIYGPKGGAFAFWFLISAFSLDAFLLAAFVFAVGRKQTNIKLS